MRLGVWVGFAMQKRCRNDADAMQTRRLHCIAHLHRICIDFDAEAAMQRQAAICITANCIAICNADSDADFTCPCARWPRALHTCVHCGCMCSQGVTRIMVELGVKQFVAQLAHKLTSAARYIHT